MKNVKNNCGKNRFQKCSEIRLFDEALVTDRACIARATKFETRKGAFRLNGRDALSKIFPSLLRSLCSLFRTRSGLFRSFSRSRRPARFAVKAANYSARNCTHACGRRVLNVELRDTCNMCVAVPGRVLVFYSITSLYCLVSCGMVYFTRRHAQRHVCKIICETVILCVNFFSNIFVKF